MKKSTIAIGFTVLGIGMLAGCQEATTGGVSPSSSSALNGVTSLHAGIATALAADSTPLDSAVIDSSGAFRIVLPSDAVPVLVRCDSAGLKLLGLVPHGMRNSIVVDSATHLAVDSLRKNKFDFSAIDSTTWMRWRTVFEARRKADSARIDSFARHSKADTSRIDTSRIDTSAWHHRIDTSRIDTSARHHRVDTSNIDTSMWHHRIDSLSSRMQKLEQMTADSKSLAMSTDSPLGTLTFFDIGKDNFPVALKESDHPQKV